MQLILVIIIITIISIIITKFLDPLLYMISRVQKLQRYIKGSMTLSLCTAV